MSGIADAYFNNCRMIVVDSPKLMSTRVRYSFFAREDGVVVGCNKAVNYIKDQTYGPVRIFAKKDGDYFVSGEPVLVVDGFYYELVTLETTNLGFLSYSGAATQMKKIVDAALGVPVIDMSARHFPWQIIEEAALAAYMGGAAGTSTEAGYNYVQKWYQPGEEFRLYASLPHAQAAVSAQFCNPESLMPSVLAAKMFHAKFPERPITVLVDYEGKELEVTKQAFEEFGEKLFAVRLDTHGARKMEGVPESEEDEWEYLSSRLDPEIFEHLRAQASRNPKIKKYLVGNGVTVTATYRMREFLDSIGAHSVKIVVSSGFNEQKTSIFSQAEAPMDFIGTGSWVKFMMFTADITHVEESGEWVKRLKVGRVHGPADDLPEVYSRV